MVVHKCEVCKKIWSKKSDYIKHVNRKFPCKTPDLEESQNDIKESLSDPKESLFKNSERIENQCNWCMKIFTTNSNYNRHIRNNCKTKKKSDKEKQELFAKLLAEMETLKQDASEMKSKIKEMNKKDRGKKINTNININQNIQNNIQNNVATVAFGKEDIKKLGNDKIEKILSRGFYSTYYMIEDTHFNEDLPEYHNVYIPSMKDKYAMKYDGKDWVLVNADELVDDIYDNKRFIIAKNLPQFYDSLTESRRGALKRWLNTPEDDKKIAEIKSEIKLMLFNKRNIPLKTRNKNQIVKKILN